MNATLHIYFLFTVIIKVIYVWVKSVIRNVIISNVTHIKSCHLSKTILSKVILSVEIASIKIGKLVKIHETQDTIKLTPQSFHRIDFRGQSFRDFYRCSLSHSIVNLPHRWGIDLSRFNKDLEITSISLLIINKMSYHRCLRKQ